MGDDRVLLTFDSVEIMEGFLQNGIPWLHQWFFNITPWNAMLTQTKRLIWLKLIGVPLHLLSSHFFKWISYKLVSFVSIDNPTSSRIIFDCVRLLIMTDYKGLINKTIAVDEGTTKYHIIAIEELGDSFRDNGPCNGITKASVDTFNDEVDVDEKLGSHMSYSEIGIFARVFDDVASDAVDSSYDNDANCCLSSKSVSNTSRALLCLPIQHVLEDESCTPLTTEAALTLRIGKDLGIHFEGKDRSVTGYLAN
ncbi:hypothetical protein GH714_011139 [Hevea brasiliensis]|uniref:Uncharacterized protein n=1 Tax=Hevea brasiliensis TaxID=3981 RepID=A0A6A6K457_HEVBR|nr:hypothetical protein GH714_011139 [Hevea brasiliensis]